MDEYEDCDHDWEWINCLNCNGYMGQGCTRCGAWSDGGDWMATNANWCECDNPLPDNYSDDMEEGFE